MLAIGAGVSKEVRFDTVSVAQEAARVGDTNPLHWDRAYAARTRFGGLIVSGAHVASLMMGTAAGFFTEYGLNVALEFSFRFERAIPADDTVQLSWVICQLREGGNGFGRVVELSGQAVRSDGTLAVSATARVMLMPESS
jgi:3-hydroxybutyryl-CoA dehydratase